MRRAAAWIFFWAVVLCGTPARADEPVRLALLIGNQSYAANVGILQNPHNDIALVGKALNAQGFTVLPAVKDATRVQILGAVRDFVRRLNQAGPGAIGFVYYSGHGAADAATNVNYLIPVDAERPGSESFWDESVKLDDVLSLLSGAGEAAKFVVFDACRNELRLPQKGAKGLVPVREQPGLFVAYTTAPGQPASDEGEGSGPYAAALAAELARPGLDHLHLFQRVKEAVYAKTKGAQQPWESNGLIRLVYLTPGKAEIAPPVPSSQAPLSEAAQAWAEIKDLKDIAVFEAFRKQYGPSNALYDTLAAERIAALKEEPSGSPAPSWWPSPSSGQHASPEAPPAARPEPQKPRETQTAIAVPKTPPLPSPPPEPACDGLLVSVAMGKSPCIKPGSGAFFKDCPDCPEMVPIPAGEFLMGSPDGEWDTYPNEGPQHKVTIAKPFAVGRTHITKGQFAKFVKATGRETDGGCYAWSGTEFKDDKSASWRSPGFGQGDDHPVVCVNWNDARAYAEWLSKTTGQAYRLLTEAEAEYSVRGVTKARPQPRYFFGNAEKDLCSYANGADETAKVKFPKWTAAPCQDGYVFTAPVMTYEPNAFGLYDVHGNAWTWTQDCWVDRYKDGPADGSESTGGNCIRRALRGGSWNDIPQFLRAASRVMVNSEGRYVGVGFRVARTLNP